jgi:hypothetical protein
MAGNDFARFAVKAAGLAAGLPRDMEAATERAALKTVTAARASIQRASGGDNRLSGRGGAKTKARGGAFVGAGYEMSKAGTHGRASASALVHMRGVLWLLDNPTKAHKIAPKVKKGRANSLQRSSWIAAQEGRYMGVKPLRFRDGSFRYGANHPGTRGKRSFWNAVDRVAPQIPAIYSDALASSMVKRLK